MKDEAAVLRRELDRIGTRRGRCISRALKERVTTWLAARRAEGRPVSELAEQLGISHATALRWTNGVRKRSMLPVHVISEPTPTPTRTMSVVSPSGFRIEGVTLMEAATLLRQLG